MRNGRQQGLTTLGLLAVIVIGGFALTCLFKLGPVYMEHWTLHQLMKQVRDDPTVVRMTPREIRDKLSKKLTVNAIHAISIRSIKVKREQGGGTLIDASYEERIPFLFNIDAVVKFPDNTMLIPTTTP